MAQFLTPLDDRKTGPLEWTLLAPLRYKTDLPGFNFPGLPPGIIEAPTGFKTDLGSIPQIAQSAVSKVGPWDLPTVIHDWGFKTQPDGITRQQWNAVLAEAMIAEKVPWRARWKINFGVWAGSYWAWRENAARIRNEKVAEFKKQIGAEIMAGTHTKNL